MDVESSKKKRNSLQPKKGTKNNSSFEFPLNVGAAKKNLEENVSDSLLKKKLNSVHDPSPPPSDIKSRGSLQKSVQDASELGMYMEENQGDDLTRVVALFTVALAHVKTKLKSINSRRYAYILRAAVEEILLRLQNDESLIKRDVEKLNNPSHSK